MFEIIMKKKQMPKKEKSDIYLFIQDKLEYLKYCAKVH